MRTLAIGDVHGHYDRLEALLLQEGIIGRCPECDGSGITYLPDDGPESGGDCDRCRGDGIARIDFDVEVVQLGDFGHWGSHNGSPTGDLLTTRAVDQWCDVVLWGNHDRALIDSAHEFSGYFRPNPEAYHFLSALRHSGKLRLAHVAHDFLLTHAGLSLAFRNQNFDSHMVGQVVKNNVHAFADWINEADDPETGDQNQMAVRDAISRERGGRSHYGGILWRDINEKLYDGFRQVFGHSASRDHVVRYVSKKWYSGQPGAAPENPSYCVDVGGKGDKQGDNCLAGIWLPDETIVRVDL